MINRGHLTVEGINSIRKIKSVGGINSTAYYALLGMNRGRSF